MLFIGIDVAKAQLEFACQPRGDPGTVPHTEDGIRDLVAHCQMLRPALIVLEATGGYEAAVVAALATAGLPVVIANPRQVRDFAKATGQPTPRPLPEAAVQALDARLTRRRQLIERLTAERHRLLPAAPGGGEAGQGRADRLHAKAARHPQCDRPQRHALDTGPHAREGLIFETVANDWLISCKRLVITYGPLLSQGGGRGRSLAPPAFVGCTSRLGRSRHDSPYRP